MPDTLDILLFERCTLEFKIKSLDDCVANDLADTEPLTILYKQKLLIRRGVLVAGLEYIKNRIDQELDLIPLSNYYEETKN